jgi:hypothetical protein
MHPTVPLLHRRFHLQNAAVPFYRFQDVTGVTGVTTRVFEVYQRSVLHLLHLLHPILDKSLPRDLLQTRQRFSLHRYRPPPELPPS